MSDRFQSGQHPDADQLSAFMEQALPAHEQEETLAHLAICPHCRSIVALSMPPAEVLPLLHPQTARRPWLSGWMMVLPAGAALAALILAGIYMRNGFVVEKHVTPTQTAQSVPPAAPAPPAPTLKLQAPGKATTRPVPASPVLAPETAPAAADKLMPLPGDGGSALHLNQNGLALSGASKAEGTATQVRVVAGPQTLPSGLRALSTVANGGEVIAIDTQHTLFFSDDAGAHWSVIHQPWQGRAVAVKVELVRAAHPADTRSAAVAPAPVGILGGTARRDAVGGPKVTLSGQITDPAGASIPRASVAITNSLTQAVRRTTTDTAGRYTVDRLDPGTYTLEAEAPGFTPQQVSGLALTPTQQTQKDLTLAVGSMAQTVEVQGQAPAALTAPPVKEKIAVTRAAAPRLPRFEITTNTSEHWTSSDGRSWQRKNE
jgi:hypothetical protein